MKQKAKKFSGRLKNLLFNSSQPNTSRNNISGVTCNYGVTNGDNVDNVVEPDRALKGKGVRYE